MGGVHIIGNGSISSNGTLPDSNRKDAFTVGEFGLEPTNNFKVFPYGGEPEPKIDLLMRNRLNYVSIRHAGLSFFAGESMIFKECRSFASKNHGMRFLGGSVVGRNLAVSFAGSSFHFDQGYDGDLQWVFSIQDEDSDHAILWEGSTKQTICILPQTFVRLPKYTT